MQKKEMKWDDLKGDGNFFTVPMMLFHKNLTILEICMKTASS